MTLREAKARDGRGAAGRVCKERKGACNLSSLLFLDIHCLSLTASNPFLPQAFHSLPMPQHALTDSFMSLSHCAAVCPWEVAVLHSYVCEVILIHKIELIRGAVFWLQIKPLITTKVCENTHTDSRTLE